MNTATLTALVLDALDEEHELSWGVLGRLLSDRDAPRRVREVVDDLVRLGLVASPRQDVFLRTGRGSAQLRKMLS